MVTGVALGLLAGCAGTERAATPAAPVPTPAPSREADPAGLEPLVLDDVPSGFTLQDDDVGRTGPTDLAEAAADAGDPGAADALAADGFVRGWQRLWVSADDEDELFLLVYEFADPAGAAAFFQRTAGEPAGAGGEGVFEVPSLPGALGVTAVSEGLAVTAVVTTVGRYLVQVIADGPEPGPSRGTVVAVATAQVERLR